MEFFTIEIKKYKNFFFSILIIEIAVAIASYILVSNGFYILAGFDPGKKFTSPILLALVVLAVAHAQFQKKKLSKLQQVTDFELRLAEYEKFYRFRLYWFLFSALVSCMLVLLTGRTLFMYFAVFDILVSLPYFPNKFLFKKELQNEEIVFI